MKRWLIALLMAAALLQSHGGKASAGSPPLVQNLPIGDLEQRVVYFAPVSARATIVMLPGGAGNIGIRRDGSMRHDRNFVIRTRDLWLERGFAVVIPDAAGTRNLRGKRSSPAYAAIVAELVSFAGKQNSKPVFLLGTSQGAIAAMNGAAHLTKGQIAGLVLTESVARMGGSGETVFDARPEKVNVPVLVVANRDDACKVASPQEAPRIVASLVNSPKAQLLEVAGGEKGNKPCGSLSAHGYAGIETDVVSRIAAWMLPLIGDKAP